MPDPIDQLVDVPSTADPANFDSRADNLLNHQFPRMIDQMNAVARAFDFYTTNSMSVTPLTVMLGEAEIEVEVAKSFLPGMTLKVVSRESPNVWMLGEVVSYDPDTGDMDLNVRYKHGIGTYDSWVVFMAATEQLDELFVAQQAIKNSASLLDYLLIADMAAGGITKRLSIGELLKRAGDVGDIKFTSRATAPPDWIFMPLAPTNLVIADEPDLFDAIGFTWGPGDGVTTFGCPWLAPDHTILQSNANLGTRTNGVVINHAHQVGAVINVAGGPSPITQVQVGGSTSTSSTGGAANIAAGARFTILIKRR